MVFFLYRSGREVWREVDDLDERMDSGAGPSKLYGTLPHSAIHSVLLVLFCLITSPRHRIYLCFSRQGIAVDCPGELIEFIVSGR